MDKNALTYIDLARVAVLSRPGGFAALWSEQIRRAGEKEQKPEFNTTLSGK